MESTWYLFPGQTLENTRISDRAHALHITKSGWNNITRHLDRKKILQEAADKEAEVKRYLDEGSKNMTKNWENSLENVRRRKEEEKMRQLEEKKEERHRKFLQLRKEQEEIRAQYMAKVKKQMFLSTGYAKELTSALITSEVIFEREKQQEFNNKIKQHDKEVDEEFWELQKQKDEEAAKADEEKRKRVAEKNQKHASELKQIIQEQARLKTKLREDQIRKEAMDNIEAVKEMEKLEQMQNEEKRRRKKELADEKKKFLEKQRELELQKIKENKELDEVIDIYKEAKHRIDCMKKQKEKELRDMEVKRREKIASMVMAEEMNRSEAEEKAIRKAMAEREEAEMQKIKARQEYDAKMKQELLKNRQDMLIKEEQKRAKEEEIKKWELLNRYKTDEHMKKYEESKRKQFWQKIIEYRNDLCEQMEDQKLDQQREKEIQEALERACVPEGHDRFFQYADEVLELAKKKGRNTVPIEKVINRYIKDMNIKTDKYGVLADPCQRGGISDIQKKLVKPSKPKICRCKLVK